MDHSLSLSPGKVTRYTVHNEIRDQEEEKVIDKTNRSCVNVCTRIDEETQSYEVSAAGSRLYTGSELESSSDMNSEDAMMDKLFQACDFQGKGRVRVSDLVKYLTAIVDMQLQDGSAVKSLIAIMDPKNKNAEIDSEEFHQGFRKWIEQIKSGHLMDMSILSSRDDSVTFDISHTDGMESLIDESTTEDKLSVSHLSSRLTDLQYLNRKLSDGIKESQSQIDSKEEELSKLTRDIQNAKSEIKRLQELADLRHEAEAENEELREQVAALNKKLDVETHKTCQSEQEKEHLKSQLEKDKAQIVKLTSDLETSKQKQEDLKSLLAKNKEKLSQLKVTCGGLDAQLAEKNECIQELQKCLRDMTKINEDLKNQIQGVQGQLSDTQHDLLSLRSELDKSSSSVKFPSLREMASDIEEDVEQMKTVSAQECPSSIHNELQDLLHDGLNLPWPLSEKELKESVVTTPDLVSQVGHAVNMSSQSTDEEAGTCEQSDLPKVDSSELSDGPQVNSQCRCDYHYDISNEKLRKFVSLLKYLKEENQKLRDMISQSNLGKKGFMERVEKDAEATQNDEGSFFIKYEQLTGQKRVRKLLNYNKMLLQEITNLKRSNVKLTEELHKSELCLCELDEEFQYSKSNLNREKQRCAELEESLYNSTLARQLDLKDIWRLVQKDVELECEDFQEDSLTTGTSDHLKEQIRKEIEALRTRLQTREASVESLKNSNLNFQLSSLNCDDIYQTSSLYNSRKLSPSSPLVDALTIDVFNGNLPMYHTSYPYSSSLVSCEDVDCYECRTARLFLQHRFATSCPSIVPSVTVSSILAQGLESNVEDVEHQINAEGDHSEARTRSLEVSTNADFCISNAPKRKRSLYGSYRRQDFIRSSGRGVNSLTPQISFPSQQSEPNSASPSPNEIALGNNTKTRHQSAPQNNNLDNSSNDLSSEHYLSVTDALNHPMGVRRSSFRLAVQCNQQENQPSSVHTQTFQTKDNSSSIEELRRPSFHAAIEHGKDEFSAFNTRTKRKVVQIASPEITESREITSQDRSSKNESILSFEVPKTSTKVVKFYLDETELNSYDGLYSEASEAKPDSYGGVYSEAAEEESDLYGELYTEVRTWGSTGHTNHTKVDTVLSSSQFSASVTASGDLDHSLSLSLRHSQEKEQIDTSILTEKEHNQYLADVNVSETARAWEISQAGMNQEILNKKEIISGNNLKDEVIQPNPERCFKAQDGKPSIPGKSSELLPSIRHGITFTSTTSAPQSLTSHSSLLTVISPPGESQVPARSLVKNQDLHEKTRESTEAGIKRSPTGEQNSSDGSPSVSEVRSSSGKTVTLASRNPVLVTHVTQSPAPTKLSKIRQSHIASKKREQMKARSMKLPELTENPELDTKTQLTPATMTDRSVTFSQVNTTTDMPQISVTDEDADVPPAPSDDIVTPSLPNSFLAKLGLSVTDPSGGDNVNQVSVDQLPGKEIESKFVSLSLAFKTDRLTLDRRISIQERLRDLAEQNVEIELQGLRSAVENLTELVTDVQFRGLLQKIKLHINVIEQAAARVSSSAEVFGAVQQEKRLCRAVEVMVLYTENLRRIREKEESELQEARKLLSEKTGNNLTSDTESSPNKRALSVSGYNSLGRMMRRRSEIALPRVIGGVGSPSLTPTSALESVPSFLGQANNFVMSQQSEEGEDPKSRFQSAVASTSMQNVVTTTMRRCSLEKQYPALSASSLSQSLSMGSTSPPMMSMKMGSVSDNRGDKMESRISKDEEAFRKGFEEGLKTKLSHEMNELRDQQNSISHSLENMMDRVEQSQLQDEEYFSRPSRLEVTLSLASTVGAQVLQYDWRSNKTMIRYLAGVFFVFLAIFVVFFCPPISTVDVKHFPKPPQ